MPFTGRRVAGRQVTEMPTGRESYGIGVIVVLGERERRLHKDGCQVQETLRQ